MRRLLPLLFLPLLATLPLTAQSLETIDQDYPEALARASTTGKLVFVDFYTAWCAPCKKLEKLVFQRDSVQEVLDEHFVLLRYDAENDTTFHLAKKHHVSSYPTGLILDAEGYVLARKYGFPGDNSRELTASVLGLTEQALRRSRGDSVLAGYSNHIDENGYPQFYIDYVDRTNTRIDSAEFQAYWATERNIFSEEYFSTLYYFASNDIPAAVGDRFLQYREVYTTLYGSLDVGIALMFMTFHRFEAAVEARNGEAFAQAETFAREALDAEFAEQVVQRYRGEWSAAAEGK
ncbi:MAG: thioredoxin family protein [Lewinella sp.]